MKINRGSATIATAIGTAAVVSAVTTAVLVSGGSHPNQTVNAHLSAASGSASPTASASPAVKPSTKPTETASLSAPAGHIQPGTTAAHSAPIKHADVIAPSDTTTTSAPAPAPVPAGPPPYSGPRIGDTCPTPGATASDDSGLAPEPITCATDNHWYLSSGLYPGKPCNDPNGVILTTSGYTCRNGTWQR